MKPAAQHIHHLPLPLSRLPLLVLLALSTAAPSLIAQDDAPAPVTYQSIDFEPLQPGQNSLPPDWQQIAGPPAEIVQDSNDAGQGQKFLRLQDTDTTDITAIRGTMFPAKRGQTFTAKALVRSSMPENPALFLSFTDARGQDIRNFPVHPPATGLGQWSPISIEVAAPKGSAAVSVVLLSYPLPTGTFDFDQITLIGPPRKQEDSETPADPTAPQPWQPTNPAQNRQQQPAPLRNNQVPTQTYDPAAP
jgi:hypothetical protein